MREIRASLHLGSASIILHNMTIHVRKATEGDVPDRKDRVITFPSNRQRFDM